MAIMASVTDLSPGAPREAENPGYPFEAYLDGRAPEVIAELPPTTAPVQGVRSRCLVFRLRPDAQIRAFVASPDADGPHPGILLLHGGSQYADQSKAIMWAKLGYVALMPDLPAFANQALIGESKGPWRLVVGEDQAYVPVASSGILDAVPPALKALDLLRAQPNVDPRHIGVWGISLGGYTTTMVCALVGDRVQAGYSLYGCGFYDLNSQTKHLNRMTPEHHQEWLKYFDAGRRADKITAPFFIAGATNDFFFWIPSVQATLDVIPAGVKNHVYAPNADHQLPVPGGQGKVTDLPADKGPSNLERVFFDYYLRGIGKPLPRVKAISQQDQAVARFTVVSPTPISGAQAWFSADNPDWSKRTWVPVPAEKLDDGTYQARLPEQASAGGLWFASVWDDRPVTVSSDLVPVASRLPATQPSPASP